MKVIYGKSALEQENISPSTVTVGTFDGIHKGHMALIERLNKTAADLNTISIMATFDPHPQMLLGQRGQTELLNTTEEKLERLEKLNLDVIAVLDFNRQFASLEAKSFIKRILIDCLNMRHFVIGYDHSFGKNRSGNIELVKSLADDYNYTFEMVGPVYDGDKPIKSSRIRNELKTGEYNKAIEMLGYNYFLTGEIIRGMGVGKKLGYPTININIPPGKLLPKDGVYAARVHVDNKIVPGMAYIGGRLTFGDENINVEVNLFDFCEDVLGKKVKLTLEQYTRAPKKFDSPEELMTALADDERQIKNILHI